MSKAWVVTEPFFCYNDEGYYIEDSDNVNKSTMKVFDSLVKAKAYARDLDENIAKAYLSDLARHYDDKCDGSAFLSTITEIEVGE